MANGYANQEKGFIVGYDTEPGSPERLGQAIRDVGALATRGRGRMQAPGGRGPALVTPNGAAVPAMATPAGSLPVPVPVATSITVNNQNSQGDTPSGSITKADSVTESAKTSHQKGAEGVAMSREAAVARGEKVTGREVTFELPSGGRTRQDTLVITPEGRLKTIESKNGPRTRETTRQLEYGEVQANGETVIPRGANAKTAGLIPGKPMKIDKHQIDRWNKD